MIAVGPSKEGFKLISDYLLGSDALDDASVFQAAHALTLWEVHPKSPVLRQLRRLGKRLGEKEFVERSPFYFLAALWILGKYGLRSHIAALIKDYIYIWRASDFLSRQVASIVPKLRNDRNARNVRRLTSLHNNPSAASVLLSLDKIANENKIPTDLEMYVLNGRQKSAYSLQRFLICLHVLTASNYSPADRIKLRKNVLIYLGDPLYVNVLQSLKI